MTVKLIGNLGDLNTAMSCKVAAPDTDKLVIVQVVNDDNTVSTLGARYREGRWYGATGKEDLTKEIIGAKHAIWAESFLFTEQSVGSHINTK